MYDDEHGKVNVTGVLVTNLINVDLILEDNLKGTVYSDDFIDLIPKHPDVLIKTFVTKTIKVSDEFREILEGGKTVGVEIYD